MQKIAVERAFGDSYREKIRIVDSWRSCFTEDVNCRQRPVGIITPYASRNCLRLESRALTFTVPFMDNE